MFHLSGPAWAALIAISTALTANAQQPAPAARTLGAEASPAQDGDLSYRSALDGYQKYTDEQVGSWRDANDNVGRIGGFRAYAREAQGGQAQGGGHEAHGGAAAAAQGKSNAPAEGAASSAPGQPAARRQAGPHSGHSKP